MKKIICIPFLLLPLLLCAQREITEEDLSKINTEIEVESIRLKDSLTENEGIVVNPLDIPFELDVFKIEKLAEKKMNIDYTTSGMTNAVYELEKGYDKLLNKYYKILVEKLNTEDKEKIKIAQRNWLKFRDSELEMIWVMSNDEYTGGGTIQKNIRAAKVCDLTKKRVYQIKEHIDQFVEF